MSPGPDLMTSSIDALAFHEERRILPVAEVKCRFKSPAKYDDMIVVRTRMLNLRRSLIHFGYEIRRDGEDTLLAEGESVHIVVGPDMQRCSLPEKYMAPFTKAMGISSQ